MLNNEIIDQLFGIKESHELPERLMTILREKPARETLFDSFLSYEQDLSFDWFVNYFQENGDRKKLKQDYTPDCIGRLIAGLQGEYTSCADICAGTGGLTVKAWNENKTAYYHCEEVSSKAVPVLLFNLAIRGVTGQVVYGDSLTQTVNAVYRLERSGKYSDIMEVGEVEEKRFDCIITNPPYSLVWDGGNKYDPRFRDFGVPPKSKADYAFLLHGLYMLKEGGTLFAIVPHGLLFRGSAEGDIRTRLITGNYMDSVIGLPDKLFLNTDIPVCIMVLKRQRQEKDVYIIDASKEFVKEKAKNNMQEEHIEKILNAYRERKFVERFAYPAQFKEVQENGFNLNIPRYVDTFEREPVPDLLETLDNLMKVDREIHDTEMQFLAMMTQLIGTDSKSNAELQNGIRRYQKMLEEKYIDKPILFCYHFTITKEKEVSRWFKRQSGCQKSFMNRSRSRQRKEGCQSMVLLS